MVVVHIWSVQDQQVVSGFLTPTPNFVFFVQEGKIGRVPYVLLGVEEGFLPVQT